MGWPAGLAAVLALALASAGTAGAAPRAARSHAGPDGGASPLRFEQVFRTDGEPDRLHFEARYGPIDAPHHLEVWREGETRLVRRTDDRIETHAVRGDDEAGYRLVVLDLARRIATHVDRTSLYRIGNFTDWFDLAHGLRHPSGDYSLAAVRPPEGAPPPAEPCRWYLLAQDGQRTAVCWSERDRLPMLLLGADAQVLWQVIRIDRQPAAAEVFQVHDAGFVHHDAAADLSAD